MRKHLLLFFLLYSTTITGQNLLGIANSNYAGTNGLYLNPASIADSRYRFFLNFFTFDAYVSNNYFTSGQRLSKLLEGTDAFKVALMQERSNGNFLGAGLDFRTLNMMVRLSPKSSLALGGRARFLLTANNVSQNIYTLARFEGENFSDQYRNVLFKDARGNLNINALAEYSLSYGQVVLNKDQHFLKAGTTLKYLSGFGSFHFRGSNVDFFIDNNDYYNMPKGDFSIGYSDPKFSNYENVQGLFTGSLGNGFGADVGVMYEFRPNPTANQYQMDGETRTDYRMNIYKYRIGFSLIDLGQITYKGEEARLYKISKVSSNDTVIVKEFDVNKPDTLAEDLGANLATQNNVRYKAPLPAMLVATLDYNLYKKFYANLTIGQNLRGKNAQGMRQASYLAITPRYEHRLLEFALPMAFTDNYRNFNVGFSMRLAYLFVGSDNIIGTLFSQNASGANVYLGLNLPIFNKKRPRDKDGDGVSDKKDKCPDTKGVLSVAGCPDRDGDGITDTEDACPEEAGLLQFKGCPDRDGDGITDKEDACPDVAGLAQFQGCPDTDKDGIPDKDDACPQEAGLAQFQGCPDTDKDGLPDKDDACPQEAGKIELKGCPDRDGDGIADKEDACPDVAGPKENKGCPLNKIEEEKLAVIAKTIQFETGKATIKKASFPSLDELAALMKQFPEAKIQVEGHTDNVGNKQANKKLSQRRANAIKNYLVRKGIAPQRINAIGFGDERPKDGSTNIKEGNKTPEQRAANRRVEIKSL